MFKETVQLEKLRQKIEDTSYEAGDKTDYLSYGKPSPEQAKQTQALIDKLNAETKSAQSELKQILETLRTQNPQIIEEWVNYHVSLLNNIINENSAHKDAKTRKFVAQETLEKWEKVRAGEMDYVNINWHFLKDYKDYVRKINEKSEISKVVQSATNQATSVQKKEEKKPFWKFW
ncbi:MAG: hypothetical protein H6635_08005 [Anaerolineales bacterium]|nr:hypothetical protein [Anaerolineales bacterium]